MHSMRHVVLLLLLLAALTGGHATSASAAPDPGHAFAAQDPCSPSPESLKDPQCDSDGDGFRNGDDLCPFEQPQPGGKGGCAPFRWFGSEGISRGGDNLGKTVRNGFVTLISLCEPDNCKTTVTLSAPKAARKALGLEKALIGRQTKTQKSGAAIFEIDLPRKVVRKLDDLDRIKLHATFEVSAPETAKMRAVKFTESATIVFDRRRNSEKNPEPPKGQGLRLFRGTPPPNCGAACAG